MGGGSGGSGSADPGLQDLHDTEQQWDVQKSPSEDAVLLCSRDQGSQTKPMILCNEHLLVKMYG